MNERFSIWPDEGQEGANLFQDAGAHRAALAVRESNPDLSSVFNLARQEVDTSMLVDVFLKASNPMWLYLALTKMGGMNPILQAKLLESLIET